MAAELGSGFNRVEALRERGIDAPDILAVAEGGVENASLAEAAHPGDREETFFLGLVGVVAHEPDGSHLVAVVVFDEIHFLLGKGPDVPDVSVGRMLLVARVEGGGNLRAVAVEGAAKHLGVRKRICEGVAASVHADKGTTRANPVGKTLGIGKRERARGVAKNHGIDAVVPEGLR